MDSDINGREYEKFDENNRVKVTPLSDGLETLIDKASATVTYIGKCIAGNSGKTDEEVWQIKKINQTSGTKISFADGSSLLNKVWDNRTTYTY